LFHDFIQATTGNYPTMESMTHNTGTK